MVDVPTAAWPWRTRGAGGVEPPPVPVGVTSSDRQQATELHRLLAAGTRSDRTLEIVTVVRLGVGDRR
jgi:hypothetical protein